MHTLICIHTLYVYLVKIYISICFLHILIYFCYASSFHIWNIDSPNNDFAQILSYRFSYCFLFLHNTCRGNLCKLYLCYGAVIQQNISTFSLAILDVTNLNCMHFNEINGLDWLQGNFVCFTRHFGLKIEMCRLRSIFQLFSIKTYLLKHILWIPVWTGDWTTWYPSFHSMIL